MRVAAVDLGERDVRVVHAVRAFGRLRLSHVERAPAADAPAVLARLRARRPDAVLTALPLALAAHRVLVLPFRRRRRLAATIPFELLGQLPVAPEDATIAWMPLATRAEGTTCLAGLVRQADVAAWLAPLGAAGLSPVDVDLAPLPIWNLVDDRGGEPALVVADGRRSSVSLARGGAVVGIRALDASAGDPESLAAEAAWALAALGEPTRIVVAGPDAGAAVRLLAARLDVPVATLRLPAWLAPAGPDGEACALAAGLVAGGTAALRFAGPATADDGALRRVAALALAAAALGVLDVGLAHHALLRRDAALVSATRAVAAAALPGSRLVAPRAQLEAAARREDAQRAAGARVLETLRDVSLRIPAGVRLDLDELAIDRDGLALHGRTDSFEGVDLVRRALAGSPLFGEAAAEETRTTVDGRRVEFRLRATRRRPREARS